MQRANVALNQIDAHLNNIVKGRSDKSVQISFDNNPIYLMILMSREYKYYTYFIFD